MIKQLISITFLMGTATIVVPVFANEAVVSTVDPEVTESLAEISVTEESKQIVPTVQESDTKKKSMVVQKEKFPPAQLGIAPPRVEKTVLVSQGKRLDQSLVLYNYNDKAKNIVLSLHDMDADKNLVKPSKNSLSPWTIINPKTFVIPSKGKQTVRMSIRPPIGFTQGKHYAMLKIQHQVKDALKLNEDKESITVSLGSSYGLPIILTAE